ncbi:glycoside hydrolase family 43 protein [Whalleya microplaca]|nr:glycoside hydrolase family 43 protein [Whalleya microplaca]
MAYDNSTLTLTSVSTPDPFVTRFNDHFLLTFTTGNRVEIWSSRNLVDIERSSRHVIWTPPPGSDFSADLWAPELHALRGRWYVYVAAAHPAHGNKSHRMYVLGGPPATAEPWQGPWAFLGRLRNLPETQWAIDGTAFELDDGALYFAYSGWPLTDPATHSDLVQQIFLVRLENPFTAAADRPPVCISRPDCAWEITTDGNGDHGINEGPQFLRAPDGSWQGLVYSCAGSWTADYKMAVLRYIGGDPLDPRAWQKGVEPLAQAGGRGRGPFGPGHGSFLQLGGGEVIAIYHATDNPTDGWGNRRARVQRVAFTEKGPYMGKSFGSLSTPGKGGLVNKVKQKLLHSKHEVGGEEGLRALLEGRGAAGRTHQEL